MCSFEGCTHQSKVRGWCMAHYNQQNRGETLRPLRNPKTNLKDMVTYYSAHTRILVSRGPAKNYLCIDNCGRQALDWSLNKDCDIVTDDAGKVYSLNPKDYDPRCRSCHMIYDESGGRTR